jgi:hypothetical protein
MHHPEPRPARSPSDAGGRARTATLIALLAGYLGIVVLGVQVGSWISGSLDFDIHLSPETDLATRRMVLLAMVAYVVLMTLPFVPGVEIGLALMVVFGAELALLVYLGTVIALIVSYLIGRLVPERALLWALARVHLRRAHALVSSVEALPMDERLQRLLESTSGRAFPWLLRYRYLAIAVALNLPGNALIGGGGGIALAAGMSRVCKFRDYLLTVLIAVAPVPLAVTLIERVMG